jgi:hypothetical protein
LAKLHKGPQFLDELNNCQMLKKVVHGFSWTAYLFYMRTL